MREIKFRILSSGYSTESGKREWQYYTLPYEHPDDEFGLVEEETIGLYTGLKDKNGVDIFEGDIIKYAYRDYTVVVKPLERGRYSAFWDFSDFLDPSDNELGAEVIGNIYENPELLKAKL